MDVTGGDAFCVDGDPGVAVVTVTALALALGLVGLPTILPISSARLIAPLAALLMMKECYYIRLK